MDRTMDILLIPALAFLIGAVLSQLLPWGYRTLRDRLRALAASTPSPSDDQLLAEIERILAPAVAAAEQVDARAVAEAIVALIRGSKR